MGHAITIGQTLSGKTLWNKRLAAWYKSQGVGVVVLDPMRDPEWNADRAFTDPDAFLAFVKNPDECLQCALFIDEAGMSLDRYNLDYQWLTCQSRHHGHVTHIIAQRAQQVSATVRSQCDTLFCFNVNPADAKIYSLDFNCELLKEAPSLPRGHFIKCCRFGEPTRHRLW